MKIKKYLRSFVFNLVALWAATLFIQGVSYTGGPQTLLLAALALTLVNLLVKPIIKLLFLPINLVTLGAFRWVINVAALYIATLMVPLFQVKGFFFPGFSLEGFIVPAIQLSSFWAYVFTSFFISLVVSFVYWLIK